MSPHVGNFVHDLVEMAKAMERLPGLEAEIARLQGMVDNYAQQVQAIELRAIDRNTEIEQLNAKIRSLEVERDDASFRVMEAEDREHTLLVKARSAEVFLSEMIGLLDPPKPLPEPSPVVSAAPDSQPKIAAQPFHLGIQDPFVPSMEQNEAFAHTAPSTLEPVSSLERPIDPHQTEAPVSVSEGPTATSASGAESPIASFTNPAPTQESASPQAFDNDPEPIERWTNEWYAWKDRQYKQA